MNRKHMLPLPSRYRSRGHRLVPVSVMVVLAILLISLTGCAGKLPATAGDALNAPSYGYTPLDPLPAFADDDYFKSDNYWKLGVFPDETMRLAVGEVNADGSISYGVARFGTKNTTYKVILDYTKADTKPLNFIVRPDKNSSKLILNYIGEDASPPTSPDEYLTTLPVYVGVGLRITADITVLSGKVELGNLLSLGLAAQAGTVTGTLTIQTLGISGEPVTAALPLPSEVSRASILNAIQAMGTIKAKLYDPSTKIHPRFIGYYNTLGGGSTTATQVISTIQRNNQKSELLISAPVVK